MGKIQKTQSADGPFQKLEAKVAKEPGVTDPAAISAVAGRKSLGQAEMTRRAVAGKKKAGHDDEPFSGPSVAAKSRPGSTNYADTPSTFASVKDPNQVIPSNLSDNAMDSIKAKSFGGVSLADFGYGAKDAEPRPGAPSVLAFGAPYAWGSGGLGGPTPAQVAGGLKASGFGSSGINGKDKAAVSGMDEISKLWK